MAKKELDPEMVKVGSRVRLARKSRHMTLEQLAEAADTSMQFLFQVEKGEQSMTMLKFGKLAKALRVSSDYLLFGREPLEDGTALAAELLGEMSPAERELLSRMIVKLEGVLEASCPEYER